MENNLKNIISLLEKRNWDTKDLSRAIGIDQRFLESILAKDNDEISVSEENLKLIYRLMKEHGPQKPDLLRFKKPVVSMIWARKGGVGKSSISTNLAFSLAHMGYNVLAIDADSQCDMTSSLLYSDPEELKHNIQWQHFYDAVRNGNEDIRDYIVNSNYDNLYVLPGSPLTENLEQDLEYLDEEDEKLQAEKGIRDDLDKQSLWLLRNRLNVIFTDNFFDFIIIDSDKNNGLLNRMLLCATDYVILTTLATAYSIKAIPSAKERIANIQNANPNLSCLGVVFNSIDGRKKMDYEMYKNLIESNKNPFSITAFDTAIPLDSNFENAQADFVPLHIKAKKSKGNIAMTDFSLEFLKRIASNIEE